MESFAIWRDSSSPEHDATDWTDRLESLRRIYASQKKQCGTTKL